MSISVSRRLQLALQQHMITWQGCQACSLRCNRASVQFFKGSCPCKILFVAESPDADSDLAGLPFPEINGGGTSLGSILKSIVPGCGFGLRFSSLQGNWVKTTSWAVTYLVSCGSTTPTDADRAACLPKFQQAYSLLSPKLVVCLGKEAHGRFISIVHTLSSRPPVIAIPHLWWISKQSDIDLEITKARLHIEEAVDKYGIS